MNDYRIIDVSHHNGNVDFAPLASRSDPARPYLVAVIAKATQGLRFKDPQYEENRRKAQDCNLLWGAYHFGTGDSPDEQLDNFLAVAALGPGDLACLDFEENTTPGESSMTLEQAARFAQAYKDRMPSRGYPMLYGGAASLAKLLAGSSHPVLSQCPLWLAQYGPRAQVPDPCWKDYTLWQYSEGGMGGGDELDKFDNSRFQGTEEQLRAAWPFRSVTAPEADHG